MDCMVALNCGYHFFVFFTPVEPSYYIPALLKDIQFLIPILLKKKDKSTTCVFFFNSLIGVIAFIV